MVEKIDVAKILGNPKITFVLGMKSVLVS